MKIRIVRNTALSAILMTCLMLTSLTARAASGVTSLVQGTATNGTTFSGTFTATGFSVVNGALVATGTLTGSVVSAGGGVIGTVDQTVQILVSSINGTCQILTLTLGPLHLNVLGLKIDLSQIVLAITAQPGTLLGSLLCDLANLLSGTLEQIATLLNQILAAL